MLKLTSEVKVQTLSLSVQLRGKTTDNSLNNWNNEYTGAVSNKDGLHGFFCPMYLTRVWGFTPTVNASSSVWEITLFLAQFQNNAVVIIKE